MSVFRMRLLAIVLLVLVPFVGLAVAEMRWDHERAMTAARDSATMMAEDKADDVADMLDRSRDVLRALSVAPAVAESDWRGAAELCANVKASDASYLNVAVTDFRGNVVASAIPTSRTVNVGDRDYFGLVMRNDRFSVSGYQVGRITGKPGIVCAYPIHDTRQRIRGIVYMSLDPAAFAAALYSDSDDPHTATTLFDSTGRIIARPNVAGEGSLVGMHYPDSKLVDAALSGLSSATEMRGLDGVERVYAVRTAFQQDSNRLAVAVGLEEDQLFAVERRGYANKVVAVLAGSIVVLMLSWVLSYVLVISPLQSLRAVVARLAKGDLSARSNLPPRGDEIGDLAVECDAMAEALGRKVEEIERSERQYRQLAQLLPVGVFALGTDLSVRFANDAGLRMLGLDALPEEGEHLCDFVADGYCESLEAYVETLGREDASHPIDLVLRDGDGLERDIEFVASWDDKVPFILAVAHDVTDRRAVERLKSDFLSMVSHELRTPLTTISGFAQLLQSDKIQDHYQVTRMAGRIEERAAHMAGLVEDIMRVLQAEARSFTGEKRPSNVRSIVKRCVEELDLPAGHEVEFHAQRHLEPVNCDPVAVSHAISNLLSNAVKFSPEGGRIVVRVSQTEGRTRITVEDPGIGVPEDARDRIFDRFAQADMSSTRRFGGFGVGLFIVRQVAEAHGGSVRVEPRRRGGSVFTLELSDAA